jgi:Zn-dependent M28 family amino/carboxypeptidase
MPRSLNARTSKLGLFLFCGAVLPLLASAGQSDSKTTATPALSPAGERLKNDVSYLADDLRGGRVDGSPGIAAAADHIASIFREAGLKPAPGATGYFQPFTIPGDMKLGGATKLAAKLGDRPPVSAETGAGFTALAPRAGKFEDAPVVFVGYGIVAKDKKREIDFDEFEGLDVKDKAVIILRGEPQADDEKSPFDGKANTPYANFIHKAANANQHGVKALLFVNDSTRSKDKDELLTFSAVVPGRAPALMISRAFADRLLEAGGASKLAELEKAIDADLKPQSKELKDVTISGEVAVERGVIQGKNVIGVLEGSGPLADETIVVGAHYDHLGNGSFGSLSMGSRDIHNGADDNASGTATVLEMARRLSKRSEPLPRRVVFMTFSGEERGLLGSQYYVNHPLYPLKDTVAMVNFDMVGRLNDKDEVTTFGLGSSPGFGELVDALGSSLGLKIKKIPGTQAEFGASDHYSFYSKNLPVVFFFTGTHADYHRPSDDTHLINFSGMERIADMGELLLLDIAKRPKRPEFVKLTNRPAPAVAAAPAASASASVRSSAYLGSRPNYAHEGTGVKLDGVTEGSPAEKAGLKGGDVITKFGDKEIATLEDYMAAMQEKKPGDSVEIVVKRDGKSVTLKAILGDRPMPNSQ